MSYSVEYYIESVVDYMYGHVEAIGILLLLHGVYHCLEYFKSIAYAYAYSRFLIETNV